jgi:hypothetical protein
MDGSDDITMNGTEGDAQTTDDLITDWSSGQPLSEWTRLPRIAVALRKDGRGLGVFCNQKANALLSQEARSYIGKLRKMSYRGVTQESHPKYNEIEHDDWFNKLGTAATDIQRQLTSEGSAITLHLVDTEEILRLGGEEKEELRSAQASTSSPSSSPLGSQTGGLEVGEKRQRGGFHPATSCKRSQVSQDE